MEIFNFRKWLSMRNYICDDCIISLIFTAYRRSCPSKYFTKVLSSRLLPHIGVQTAVYFGYCFLSSGSGKRSGGDLNVFQK